LNEEGATESWAAVITCMGKLLDLPEPPALPELF
jgi:hypothetical protein